MSGKKLADRLDWNAMLGFEQVVEQRDSLRSDGSQRLGAKVGEKPGTKPIGAISSKTGIKTGGKPVGNIGALIGVKAGIKPV